MAPGSDTLASLITRGPQLPGILSTLAMLLIHSVFYEPRFYCPIKDTVYLFIDASFSLFVITWRALFPLPRIRYKPSKYPHALANLAILPELSRVAPL